MVRFTAGDIDNRGSEVEIFSKIGIYHYKDISISQKERYRRDFLSYNGNVNFRFCIKLVLECIE